VRAAGGGGWARGWPGPRQDLGRGLRGRCRDGGGGGTLAWSRCLVPASRYTRHVTRSHQEPWAAAAPAPAAECPAQRPADPDPQQAAPGEIPPEEAALGEAAAGEAASGEAAPGLAASPAAASPARKVEPRPLQAPDHEIPVYLDLAYRDRFWARRQYEDQADRIALRRLLPPSGEQLLEVGAGYGRLASEYIGYCEVVLLDASEAHVKAAQAQFAGDARIRAVLGDAYHLPFEDSSFDTVVCVRVVHYLTDPGAVFRELGRVLRPDGALVLEFANKRHLKAMVRFALRLQRWSPHTPEPYEYRPLHFDRHPAEIRRLLREAGFTVERQLAASLFRIPALSRHIPAAWLAAAERPLQPLLGPVTPGPSVFLLARRRS
jgi:ubiquinone/menaquinone biosynthesis C-methylase UbiE